MSDPAAALRELSEPWSAGDKVKAAIARVARLTGLSYWRCHDVWYGRARKIEDRERTLIAQALEKKRREAARNEIHELRLRITRLEAIIARTHGDGEAAS